MAVHIVSFLKKSYIGHLKSMVNATLFALQKLMSTLLIQSLNKK